MKKIPFLCIAFLGFAGAFAQSEVEKASSTVSKAAIEGHIYFLADDLLKGRETGTQENKIAASYLANSLRSYGVKPNPQTGNYYQEVPLKQTGPPENMTFSISGQEMENAVPVQMIETDFEGEAVFLDYGLEEDYNGKDVSGKLVIVKGGNSETTEIRAAMGLRQHKNKLAQEAGAVGVVELVQVDERIWGFISSGANSTRVEVVNEEEETNLDLLPYLWVRDQDNTKEKELANGNNLSASLQMDAQSVEYITSQNVIGVVEGTDPELKNEYIIYSAHYDHVGVGAPDETGDSIYNGARDNAVGTTTVLMMAENLTKHPTKRSALFILFTGEEKGLLGSRYYVENPVLPLEQMVYCFNSDNAGYNDTSVATIIGLERTTAAKHIKEAASTFGITAIDDPAPEQGLFDRSDNVAFASKGISAPTFSLGFRAFDGDVTKYYHRPGDEAENVDFDYLLKFFQAYVLSGRLIANDTETPFWTAGDKYEPAGKELYGTE